jgi:hypothetical protein
MKQPRPVIWFILAPILLISVSAVFISLITVQPASAQCGTSASSCKTCHEVEAKDPVNTDGTNWHKSHAFGDFCAFCHAGNPQATLKEEAHNGLVPPLSDPKAACQSCHTNDLNERVQVYAVLLKKPAGGDTQNSAAPTTAPAQGPAQGSGTATVQPIVQPTVPPAAQPTISAQVAGGPVSAALDDKQIVVDDPNVVDYVQRYNEIVLGQRPVNWGNIILIALIGLVVVVGGGFVIFNEIRIRAAASATRKVDGEYPVEVVEMLPALVNLKPQSRRSLRNILAHPRKTDKVLDVIDKLVSDEPSEE